MPNRKLISRKVTEEVFALDDELAHGRDTEDLDDTDEDEDEDVAAPRRTTEGRA